MPARASQARADEVDHGLIHDMLNSDLDQLDEFAAAVIRAIDTSA